MTEKVYDPKVVRKQIFLLIIPVMLENIFQMSAGFISAAMVGRLSPMLISAQGICSRITGILWCLFKGIGVGATVVIAKNRDESNMGRCRKTFEQTCVTGLILSGVLIVVLFYFSPGILEFFTDSRDTLKAASDYLKIAVLTAPFLLIMSAVTAAFQACGNTKTPMYVAVVVNIINVALGYLLIYGKFGFPRLEVIGAAVALLISQACGAFMGIYLLYNGRNGMFSTVSTDGENDLSFVKQVYAIGIPAAFETMFWQLSAIIMSKIILSYGELTFAAYQLGLQAEMMSEMPAVGVGIASTSLTAYAIGKKDGPLLKIYSKQLITTSAAISMFSSLLIIIFPRIFMDLCTNNPDIKAIGIKYLIVMGFIQVPQNLSKVLNGTIRSAGHKNIPMIISFIGIWAVRVPLALLFAYVLKLDIMFIWYCMAIDQIVKFLLSLAIFKIKKADVIADY
ncbi:MAG TPA: MATE family efflux transporter [Clostridiales bacterium]|nr:MATE family efflux transporter [Clostridiales bacterium]